MEWIETIWETRWAAALIVAGASFAVAWVVEVIILGVLRRLAAKTATDLDDVVIELLKRPIYVSLLLVGFDWAIQRWDPAGGLVEGIARSLFYSVAIVLWSLALLRLSRVLLKAIAGKATPGSVVQVRTLPLFDMIGRSAVLAGSIYLAMIAWDINVGAWLASAGVVGVAVGFAAQDSLANYFAGVFIIADAPYKLHDVITLDDGTRGKVIDIGLRSTRIHTKDGVEINIPNSILGNMKIENRSAGPSPEERIAVEIGVAYGSDLEQVIEILEGAVKAVPHILRERPPEVYFKAFGASSLDFDVKVWIEPARYEEVRHALHMRIYEALDAADVVIPFPQQDLHVKELPSEAA